MNFAKGRATKGRGTSFKGALLYVLHDPGADTANRVGFVELRNLATDNADRAWREMMTLCEAADDLKRQAGIKATGRKLEKPVYAFSLNWHQDDHPTPEHMRETALSALQTLGMENLQAVIVEHTDTAHRHVHIIVNLVDPDTGKAVSVSNDEHKLDRWADDYEVTWGVIRSPDRRAKFEALDNGRKPPKRPTQAQSREEWLAIRKAKGEQAKAHAAEIHATFAARFAALKESQNLAYEARRAESDRLWKTYQGDRKAIRDRYQPFIDAIYKSKRKAPPHPHTEQALRDLEETAEWKELGRQQFKQRRAFNARERSLLGVVSNAVRLHYAQTNPKARPSFLWLLVSRNARQQQFQQQQEGQKQALRSRQRTRRKARADTLRAACRAEQARLAENFLDKRKDLQARHARETAAQKAARRDLAVERDQTWAEYRRTFEIPERDQRRDQGGERTTREQFNAAAKGEDRQPGSAQQTSIADQFRGSAAGGSAQAASPEPKRRDWRARRSAAERKADGSYKARDRNRGRDSEHPGRTRERDRYDHD
jgi:hypothetical protein